MYPPRIEEMHRREDCKTMSVDQHNRRTDERQPAIGLSAADDQGISSNAIGFPHPDTKVFHAEYVMRPVVRSSTRKTARTAE